MTLPTLSTKTQLIVLGVSCLICFASGRFLAGKAEVKTEQQITENKTVDQDRDTHTHTVTVTTKAKDGATQITQTQDSDTIDIKDIKANIQEDTKTDTIPPKTNLTNVSALVSNNFSNGLFSPAYGVSVTHQIFGPFTVGAFGLNSGVVGVSIGVNF
jgi:hypothetical protein